MTAVRDNWWRNEFKPAEGGGVDYISRDGKTAVEVKPGTNGSRDFYSAVMHLAIFLERNSAVQRACLVLSRSRMSSDRLKDEWRSSIEVLRNPVADRLGLVVVENENSWTVPDDSYLRRVANAFECETQNDAHVQYEVARQSPGQKPYEVLKVLVSRWLQKLGPIAIGALASEVGCSYPTVRKALGKASLRHALRIASNRSVELRAFPYDAWNELVGHSRATRVSFRFQDQSGNKPTPQDLLKRLERLKPPHLALGGVAAARHWNPDFDLHGTPRLDMVCHRPDGKIDLTFVREIDPALKIVDEPSASAVLVVHRLVREASLFATNSNGGIPWADPVEVVLDLIDLSLIPQANQLLSHFRPETRLG